MSTVCILYHLARADFFERVRRYGFLIVAGITIYVSYLCVPGRDAGYTVLRLGGQIDGGGYRGVYNSAWIGAMVAWITPLLLSLFGFFLVKNTVERDQRSGVGQVIAASPVTRTHYVFGKWLSNLTVLAAIIALMILAATGMQFIRGEDLHVDFWALLSPFLMIVLPAMAVVAALAVLFETIPGLRGGFGNLVYFIVWVFVALSPVTSFWETGDVPAYDLTGATVLLGSMQEAVRTRFPDYQGGFGGIEVGVAAGTVQTFDWTGVSWTIRILLERLMWAGVAVGIVLLTGSLFHRFDPTHLLAPGYRGSARSMRRRIADWWRRYWHRSTPAAGVEIVEANVLLVGIHLPPVARANPLLCLGRTLLAELRMLLKGQRWWWILGALGLYVRSLMSSAIDARRVWLLILWIWPVLIWSGMGVRESLERTRQLVFSAPYPIQRQLPASWMAGVILTAVMGSGVAVQLIRGGQWIPLFAWFSGALFIPSLALALGVWSGSTKLFEVAYVLLWYAGPVEGIAVLDFMGASSQTVDPGLVLGHLGVTVLLLVAAVLGRWRQLSI